jgi:hypothetical protein
MMPAATAMRSALVYTCLSAAALVNAADTAVTVAEAGYAVRMPGPTEIVEQKEQLGYARWHRAAANGHSYLVGYSDNLGVDVTAEETLDELQAGYVGADRVVSLRRITLAGHPGRDLVIKGHGLTTFLRLFCTGKRSYHAGVTARDGDASADRAESLFRSFRILQPAILPHSVPAGARDAARQHGACASANWRACVDLGIEYADRKDPAAAAELRDAARELARRCDAGDALACAALGFFYLEGWGVKKDQSRGATHLERACSAGVGEGCLNLANCYSEGTGVARDEPRAQNYYRMALEAFQPRCMRGDGDACA